MEMVGAAMAPLAMILTGALVAQCRIRHALRFRHVAATLAFRFVIVPGVVLALLRAGDVPATPLVALVLMVQAAAPPAMNTALVARRYDGEWEVVSALLLVTNLCALVALPVWMAVAMKL
jgi:predicted permease